MRTHSGQFKVRVESDSAPRKRSTLEILRRVSIYLRPYRWLAAANIACAILSLGFAFTFPRLTQFLIDDVIGKNQYQRLGPTILGLLGAFFFRDAFNSLRIRINNVFEQNVIFDLRRDLYAHLQRLPVHYFERHASGDLLTRVVEDVNSVERVLIDGTEQGTVALLSIGGVLAILLLTNPVLAAVAIAPLPLLAAGALIYTLTAHRRYRAQRQAAGAMNALLMDNLQGVREIKAFARENHEEARFSGKADALRQGTLRVMLAWANYSPAMSFITALGTVLVLWVGGRQVMQGEVSLGALVGFLFYLALFYEPIAKLHGLNQMLQGARAAGERVFEVLDHEIEPYEIKGAVSFPSRVAGDVRFEAVHFAYDQNQPVLHDINLHARPGEMIALVGPSGSGKSTLMNLLLGFYRPIAGAIKVDGVDISKVALASLRSQIAVVNQEPFLFNGTIRENILFGRLDATPEELMAVTQAANCHDFIKNLPRTFDTVVGERGIKLSVGEKQRVSIARALLADKPVLILDEATASVDAATERLIQEALEHLMDGRTSFVIAHRLSTIRRSDLILVLRHGRLVESGTHQTLLRANGLYTRLARIQSTGLHDDDISDWELDDVSIG